MTIDRRSLVSRHKIKLSQANPEHVLTVGNGDFGVTVDASGMQTFSDYHDQSAEVARAVGASPHDPFNAVLGSRPVVDTATLSNWGWHEMPNPEGYVLDDAMTEYPTSRGPVNYPDKYDMAAAFTGIEPQPEFRAGAWLHVNPQRVDLGRLGLELRATPDAQPEQNPSALGDFDQQQDLWSGIVKTNYSYAGASMSIITVADPSESIVAYQIVSPLLLDHRARLVLRFPYASTSFLSAADWGSPAAHHTEIIRNSGRSTTIQRTLDQTTYFVQIETTEKCAIELDPLTHCVVIDIQGEAVELVARFGLSPTPSPLQSFDTIVARAERAGDEFWSSGAALDLGDCSDPRAVELERRMILSQHLTRIHCSGALPPQETGLATNSWQGKFHLEMHYWHAAHFASWGKPALLLNSLYWYLDCLDVARETAKKQKYPGARWPKSVGPKGRESPSHIGALLAWQQPHPIHMLELVWQASKEEERSALLERFAGLVHDTATFMAAFPQQVEGKFHLGSPIMPAQEAYDARTTTNPTFELAYWWFGLELAQRWRERSGEARNEEWEVVKNALAAPPQRDGRYLAVEGEAELCRHDHPSLLAAYGVVPPTPLIDPATMLRTLNDVLNDWNWPTAWGWDFPVMAMTATRLGQRELAVDILLRDEGRNRINETGHSPQLGALLPIYLPANGAILSAIALMASPGPDGRPIGFPDDWNIQAEGFLASLS